MGRFGSLFSYTLYSTYIVWLIRGNETVGLGLVMPDFEKVHGYPLTTGWKAVCIATLFVKNLECWSNYPTGEGIIEEGCFSAWPDDKLQYFIGDKGEKIILKTIYFNNHCKVNEFIVSRT